MDIYLIRHAIAVPRGDEAFDHARPLTARGRDRFEGVVEGLRKLGAKLDRVYSSPWTRARQTGELLDVISEGGVVETEELVRRPRQELLGLVEGSQVALVGHDPWLGELAALLLTGEVGHGASFCFKKGGVAHLVGDATPGGCELRALYTPKALRALR